MTTLPTPEGDLSPEMKCELRDIEIGVLTHAVDDIGRWLRGEIEQNAHVIEYQAVESLWADLLALLRVGDWSQIAAGDEPDWLTPCAWQFQAATPYEAWCNWMMQAVREVTRQAARIARHHPTVIEAIVSLEESYEDLLYQVMARRGEPA